MSILRPLPRAVLVPAFVIVLMGGLSLAAQPAPRVAAASDLKFALEEVSAQFTRQSGARVGLVFGSSGTLARQILDGAPFELFLSADEGFVTRLAEAGLTRDRGSLYAIGRVVLFAPRGSPLMIDERLDGVRAWLATNPAGKFAIANPEHAPYGRAAEAVLRARQLWEPLRPALVMGENVAQTATFATTGNAVGGILAHSLVLAPPLRGLGRYVLLPDSMHPPLRQRMVLLKRASATAERFYQFLQGEDGREILRRYGFAPGPTPGNPGAGR